MKGMVFFFLLPLSILLLQTSNCETVVVDGFTHYTDPTATIGDTFIFKHKDNYSVYIFRDKDAFTSCNFTQATLLSNPASPTYTWHPSRPGYFYFSFYNGTTKPCQQGQKLAVEVTPHSPPPAGLPEIPPPVTPGSEVATSPAYPWPFQPHEKASPGPILGTGAGDISPAPALSPMFSGKEGSIPFINSNPAVPLPSGVVDSTTIKPLSTSANHASKGVAVGLVGGILSLCVSVIVIL